MTSQTERDIRDLSRSHLASLDEDSFYRTFYGKPDVGQSAWEPVSILRDDEIRKVMLARRLRDRYGIQGPSKMADTFLRLVVSRDGIGREQGIRTKIGEQRRKESLFRRFWPFGNPPDDGGD